MTVLLAPFEQQYSRALRSVGLGSRTLENGSTEEVETVDQDVEKSVQHNAAVKPIVAINLFQHPEAHPIALGLALLHKYGPEWVIWESETLEARIPVDFKTNSISVVNMEKILTIKSLHTLSSFWTNWEVFSPLVNPLNNMMADFMFIQAPAYGEVVAAADIAGHVRTDVTWSDEVKLYIESVMRHDGVVVGIEPLHEISPDMDGHLIDVESIRTRWPVVRQTDRPPSDETFEGEQLRRMLAVHRYVESRRQQLRDQLPLVLTT